MTEIVPLDDRAVLKVRKLDEKTAGGIILTHEYKDKQDMAQLEAEVIALGEFCLVDCTIRPNIGDTVLITRYAGVIYHIEGEEYRIVAPGDMLGIKQ